MEYKCGVCGEKIKRDLLVYINHTEQHIISEIRRNHPEWVHEDGVCDKCVEYYRDQIQGESTQKDGS